VIKKFSKVIRLEQPYCTEEYWFLADYYPKKEQISKPFHYLHKAYKTMPGEKELIPPMVYILLERGHTGYTLPFLYRYVEDSGWNDVMNEFAHHKRMKSKIGTGEHPAPPILRATYCGLSRIRLFSLLAQIYYRFFHSYSPAWFCPTVFSYRYQRHYYISSDSRWRFGQLYQHTLTD